MSDLIAAGVNVAMQTSNALNPEDFVSVSPVVARVVAELFAAHPAMANLLEVQLAILGVTSRYVQQLKGAQGPAPELESAEVRRELLFLANTARPLPGAPGTTAADLFVAASMKIAGGSSNAATIPAVRAFEDAIGRIVHFARRTARARQRQR